jgi:glycosyltransferase involved in cell wall biosynthesis
MTSPLRVGYLSLLSPPGQPAVSGVPKVSETLLRAYECRDDITVDAVTLVDGLGAPEKTVRGPVRYHYLPCKIRAKTATLYAAEVQRLRRALGAARVQVVHGQPSSEFLLAATTCRRPHVLTIHGLVFRETQGLPLWRPGVWAGWLREQFQRWAVRRSRHVISISPYVEEYLQGWSSARIWPIPNPIDDEFFTVAPPLNEELRILCVGLVCSRKNQLLLVRACGELAREGLKFECHLVGQVLPEFGEQVQSLVTELGLAGRVRLQGMVDRQALLAEYAWSNVVVLPSREETAPLSLIQGMAAGRYVLGARSAGIPSLLADGRYGGLFPGDEPAALAAALRQFAASPQRFQDRVHLGQAAARDRYRPSAVAERTIALYREISAGAESKAQ